MEKENLAIKQQIILVMFMTSKGMQTDVHKTTPPTENEQKLALAIGLHLLDPLGMFKFGDKIYIRGVDCDNILEYSFEINGQTWTWQND